MIHVALKIPLGLFAFCGHAKGYYPADSWVQSLCDSFDDSSFSGCIATLEEQEDALPLARERALGPEPHQPWELKLWELKLSMRHWVGLMVPGW